MIAPVELPAHLPLVIGGPQPGPEAADGRLGGRANDVSIRRRFAERRSRHSSTGRTGPPSSDRPCSDRLLGRRRTVRRAHPTTYSRMSVRQVAEGDGRHGCVRAHGRFERLYERGELRVDPGLVMDALQQLPARSQFPRELREDLVLLVGPRELRAGARLTVVVAQILVSREKPQPIANSGAADVRREVR